MKPKNIIQRLCLFLLVLVLAAPAWATNFGCARYEVFRSRELGKHQTVTTLRKGKVEITFSRCNTTGGTGSGAIYELAKGSRITVKAIDGYRIRWIILRDTEGGKRYSHKDGIKRINRVTSGYNYYFEKNAISNSKIKEGNQQDLNDDDNNIVVYQNDASAQSIDIVTHNNSDWDQFKVRDIIVGVVNELHVKYQQEEYSTYTVGWGIAPGCTRPNRYTGLPKYKVDNEYVATVNNGGILKVKHPGTIVLTATFPPDEWFSGAECSTKVHVLRDKVTFTAKDLPDMLYTPYDFRSLLQTSTLSDKEFRWDNPQFSITSSNSSVLSCDNGMLKPGGTSGEATITVRQEENDFYEPASFSHTFIVVRRDQYGTILIKDANEWKLFCKLVNDKGMTNLNARLEADVNLGSDIAMVGTTSHLYAGTFDGKNHTLKFNWNGGSDSDIAPFKKVSNATIKNLRTEGTIKSNSYYLSGLVGDAYGTVNISNCASNVNITSSHTGGICDAAGMISYIDSNAKVAITDCLVEGNITAMTNEGKKRMSGFVFYQYGTCTLTNCLYIGENNADNTNGDSNTFANNATVTNCYYLNTCGTTQGDRVTEEQLKSGYVAYNLQNGRNNTVWGQMLGTNDEPLLTADGAKRVRKVEFTYNNRVKATCYATHGKAIYGSMPTFTPKDLLGSDYNEHHYYSGIAFEDGFNGSTTVTSDKQVRINLTEKDCYEIASADNWKEFCNIVNNSGQNAVDAKLTADVDLETEITMVGTNRRYSGTFDGQNHTLKINWNSGNAIHIAPFKNVDGATIKNLRVEGEINSSTHFLSGLICNVYGTTTISGCVSAVNITSSYDDGGCDAAGIIECVRGNAKVTITDCVVKGKFNATTEKGKRSMAGFVNNQYGTCTLNNCLYAGENNCSRGYTFCTNSFSGTTITNCYYLNACGTAQGTKITEEQLRNGEVAYLLQNGRNTQFWGQTLGTDKEPLLTSDEAKHIYKVDFAYNNEVKATRYATRNNAIYGGMPTFTAQGLMGSEYNEHHYYTLAFAGGFNGSTTVSSDQTVAVLFNHKEAYEIASKDNWKTFCDLVNSGQTKLDAKQMQNIDLGGDIVMVGVIRNYSGTFDGQGHSLTVNWNYTGFDDIAPFKNVKGATIKNLHVKGQIEATGNSLLSGLILSASGKISVSGCVIDVDLKGSSYLAGMIHMVNLNTEVIITDCVVKGALNSATKSIGGFVDYQSGSCTLTNCLYAGTNNATTGSNTFADNATVTNCYYLNACGTAQGTQVTAEQLKNGEVAYKLQNGRSENIWGQTLGTDKEPLLTTDEAKHIYKVDFAYKNNVRAARYANKGGTVSLPTLQEALGNSYNPHHYYTGLAFADGFSETTTIDDDKTVTVTVNDKECYDIASKEDWQAFRELVNDGQTGVDASLTQDVDLGEEILMLGYYLPNIYEGTFDGQGHTLSFNWTTPDNEKAPFKNVKDATIRNLRVKGSITLTEKKPGDPQSRGSQAAGLINYAYGNTTISGCVIDVDLKAIGSLAGILQWPDDTAHITINDCVVKGYFHATDTVEGGISKTISGFIGHRHKDASCTLNNCLYAGTNNVIKRKDGFTFSSDFEHNEGVGFTRITNCYYLNPCGKIQGDRVTADQLKSGEVAKMLQADRNDQCYWAQALGEEPTPYREADKAEANYVYYNKENNGWVCDDFRLTDDKPLPIGLDFLATKATYERDLSMAKATLCLPYDLPVQGFKAYTLSGGNKNEVHFKEVDDKLTAYTPYYITANGMPQLGGRNIEVKAYKADKMTIPAAGYKFTGTVAGVSNATAAAANAYILQDDGKFHKVTTANPAATIPAYRAYIICPPQASGAKQLSVVLDGETTGIGDVTNEATDGKNGPVYDLQGRRVADRLDDATRHSLPAGVYIVGGRKVVVK